jgi:hypothetical protein
MSRSGYSDDYDDEWGRIRWRGAVASAISGRRGQAFLREMLTSLDAIPTKQLISHDLETLDGVCALGSVTRRRAIDTTPMDLEDSEDRERLAAILGIAPSLVCEIAYENDEGSYWRETSERRWERVRAWVISNLATT